MLLIGNTALCTSGGNWVLQQGTDQLGHWLRPGPDITVSVNVNVSAQHLQEPLFADSPSTCRHPGAVRLDA